MATIVLDPGHGGTQAIGNSSPNNATGPAGTREKNMTREIALETGTALMGMGHQVRLTREQDTNLGLAARAHVARDLQAPVFVSIHFNGNTNPATQGTEVWLHSIHTDDSKLLASSILQRLVATTGYANRGVRSNQLGVLNPSQHFIGTAACLVEISFMTNAADEQRLQSAPYRRQLGHALAIGINDFLNGSTSNVVQPVPSPIPVPDGDI
jgi:N-acetylmuramoyl-L-alanine amidase